MVYMSNMQCILISSVDFLTHFNIVIEPHRESPKKICGSTTNDINFGETVSFTCHPNAMGTALKITTIRRVTKLSLCEVSVFGNGTN